MIDDAMNVPKAVRSLINSRANSLARDLAEGVLVDWLHGRLRAAGVKLEGDIQSAAAELAGLGVKELLHDLRESATQGGD